jgi:hypothetical protein
VSLGFLRAIDVSASSWLVGLKDSMLSFRFVVLAKSALEFFSRSILEFPANSIAHVDYRDVSTATPSFSSSLGRASLHVVSQGCEVGN